MKNIKNSISLVSLLLASVFLQSFSFLSIKFSTTHENIFMLLLALALFFLVIRAIVWQVLLKYVELSKVYPFASLVQVLIFIYAVVIFDEDITNQNIIGLIIMLSGIYYISKKDDA